MMHLYSEAQYNYWFISLSLLCSCPAKWPIGILERLRQVNWDINLGKLLSFLMFQRLFFFFFLESLVFSFHILMEGERIFCGMIHLVYSKDNVSHSKEEIGRAKVAYPQYVLQSLLLYFSIRAFTFNTQSTYIVSHNQFCFKSVGEVWSQGILAAKLPVKRRDKLSP